MTQVQMAFGDSLKSFADTLHHLAFRSPSSNDDDDDPDEGPRSTVRLPFSFFLLLNHLLSFIVTILVYLFYWVLSVYYFQTVHRQLRIVAYILETRNVVIGNLWSHFNEMFKLVSNHQGFYFFLNVVFLSLFYFLSCVLTKSAVEEDVLGSPLEVFHHLGNMTVARYIHDRISLLLITIVS